MRKVLLRGLVLGAIISTGLANPLRIDLDIQGDLRSDDFGATGVEKALKSPLDPKVADVPTVVLPFERHQASPPINVSLGDLLYVLSSTYLL
jgi:hypothetical protein